ncbi:MAG TPA: aldo/keto reductase [Anaerolineales bacterium]|nr:aldo/keto reductase [Anaerolineales bacterium]
MQSFPLSAHGIRASRLILGCMSLGGGWNSDPISRADLEAGARAVDAALAAGITMFDHADIYTRGKAETVFGEILRQRPGLRERIVIQSKCGIRFADDAGPGRFDFSRTHILASVEGSLRRLQTDFLDVLLLHRPDPLMEPAEIAEAFQALRTAGKVRHFGVSNMNVGQIQFLQRALSYPLIVNQLEMSLAHRHWLDQGVHVNQSAGTAVHFGEGLLEFSQAEGIQLQAWGPLAKGIFTGATPSDASTSVFETAALVRKLADNWGAAPEAVVLGWLMRHPAGIQPVIGTIRPERIAACAAAERIAERMSREDWYALYVAARGAPMP